jgi:hypothetical protein
LQSAPDIQNLYLLSVAAQAQLAGKQELNFKSRFTKAILLFAAIDAKLPFRKPNSSRQSLYLYDQCACRHTYNSARK